MEKYNAADASEMLGTALLQAKNKEAGSPNKTDIVTGQGQTDRSPNKTNQ
jgi:hypothetical protein